MRYSPNEMMSLEIKYKDDYEVTQLLNEIKRLNSLLIWRDKPVGEME